MWISGDHFQCIKKGGHLQRGKPEQSSNNNAARKPFSLILQQARPNFTAHTVAEWEQIGKEVKSIAWIVVVFLFDFLSVILQYYAVLEGNPGLLGADNSTTRGHTAIFGISTFCLPVRSVMRIIQVGKWTEVLCTIDHFAV